MSGDAGLVHAMLVRPKKGYSEGVVRMKIKNLLKIEDKDIKPLDGGLHITFTQPLTRMGHSAARRKLALYVIFD